MQSQMTNFTFVSPTANTVLAPSGRPVVTSANAIPEGVLSDPSANAMRNKARPTLPADDFETLLAAALRRKA